MSDVLMDRGIFEVEQLPFWSSTVKVWPLLGGTTNRNYAVQQSDGQRFAVRLGQDVPQHGIMRFNEQAAARAAARIGISPKIYYTAPGVLISRLLPGRSLTRDEVRLPQNLGRVAALIRRCHTDITQYLDGPLLAFWVFHINRSYATALSKQQTNLPELPKLMELNDALERRVGKVDIVFTHNDLRCGNVFDDGARLWLLDWDYAGFNTPLFDLANLSSHNGFYPSDDAALLSAYFGAMPDAATYEAFRALKCAALLRDALAAALSDEAGRGLKAATPAGEYLSRLHVAIADLG
jgi:thiamine kinase-like enzyme